MENESPVKQWSHLHKILYRLNKIISGIRITVEHAIAGIKRLGCMTQILRNRRPFIDDTFLLLSAGLWNFHLRTA
ncbi:hypothetical protein [Symbiopectobacterium purcellii]|uniref:hypothetical protein n=1 Tax=Symbiopectobacterium purcellii TaxID=2871826 RepID=UPI003F854BBE